MKNPRSAQVNRGPVGRFNALNRVTKDIKEALISGAISSDYAHDPDNDAPNSLTTYMRTVANRHPELFFSRQL